MTLGDMNTDWCCCRDLLIQGVSLNTTDQHLINIFNEFLERGKGNNVWATFDIEPYGRPQYVIEVKKGVKVNGSELPETKSYYFARAEDGQWFELERERWPVLYSYGFQEMSIGMAYCNKDRIHHRFSIWKDTCVMMDEVSLQHRKEFDMDRPLQSYQSY